MTATTARVRVGTYEIDAPTVGSRLYTETDAVTRALFACEYPEFAPFRLESAALKAVTGCVGPAVRVEVTGRTIQRKYGENVVAVRVVVVGDGEPDTVLTGCYMVVTGLVWVG